MRGRSEGGRGRGWPIGPWVRGRASRPGAALHPARPAEARPRPEQPRNPAARSPAARSPAAPHPDQSGSAFQRHRRQASSPTLPRASSLACPQRGPRPRKHPDPRVPFRPRCQNFSEQVQPGAHGCGPAPRPSLTLSRQLTFSVGYTTFPQRAHWGFIVAVPVGGGEAVAAGGSEEPL